VTNAISIHDISKSFGSIKVIENVSLTVPAGQALGIVGPNGAGKTTLLSLISGTERVSSGKVEILGKDVTPLGPEARAKLAIGRTFQIPRPFTHLTVYENALSGAIFGANLGGQAAEEAALEALRVSDLIPHANTPAGQLPLLARKRLELARALATNPQVLLLDEIAGGLTEAECESLVQTIIELKSSGITIIWIEHVVQALVAVVDRLVCLATGSIIADGKPEEVLKSDEVLQVYLGGGPNDRASKGN